MKFSKLAFLLLCLPVAAVQIDSFILNPDPNTPLTAGGSYLMTFSDALTPGYFLWDDDQESGLFYAGWITVDGSSAHAAFSHQEAFEAGEFDFNVETGALLNIVAYRAGGPELEFIPCNPHIEYDPATGSGSLSWLAADPPSQGVPDMAWTPALLLLGCAGLWMKSKK